MNKYTKILNDNKKSIIYISLMLLVLIVVYFIMSNNYSLYSKTIIKISDVNIVSSYDKIGTNGDSEKYYVQQLTGTIKNGTHKGETVSFSNEYSYSSVTTSEYKKGNEVFADLTKTDGQVSATITGEKRDTYIILLLVIFSFVTVAASGRCGIMTLASVFINLGLFAGSISLFGTGRFLNFIWIILLFIFTTVTLIFAAGFNKKALGAIISTFCTTAVIILLYVLTVYNHYDLPYDTMEYVVAFLPLKKIYLISIIIGCLGAVMDVSVTVSASTAEMISACGEQLDMTTLIKSLREIGRDIMGTMVNVLFFSYISGTIPLVVLQMTNNIGFNLILKYDYIFDIIRFLIGSVGIITAIPISAVVSVLLYKKGLSG